MKAIILRATTIIAIIMAVTAVSAQAQTSSNKQTFIVPFQFNVGDKVLPAGEYAVFVENQTIRLRKSDGKANVITLYPRTVRSSRVDSQRKLTFRQYGDHLYLSQVWLSDGLGRELKLQRKYNTDLAANFSIVDVPAETR